MRTVMICGGGDWHDASADLLIEPEGANIEEDVKEYPGFKAGGNRFIVKWLIEEKGYREPTEEEATVVWETP